MPHLLEDFNFSCDSLDVFLIMYFVFFKDFNGNLFTSKSVLSKLNLAADYFTMMFDYIMNELILSLKIVV